ncbi:unnamed protein product [Hymenolepis diminuta]|uniref:Uncharacterized protein n=1 Tax=Hymenolepis diminuta TaxID=6216 RepID=A0A564Y3E9_HYMDI|nr:unnamed protein product [Hymenolepis diminuta]
MLWRIVLSIFLILNSINAFWFIKPTEEECESTIRLYDQIFLVPEPMSNQLCKMPSQKSTSFVASSVLA